MKTPNGGTMPDLELRPAGWDSNNNPLWYEVPLPDGGIAVVRPHTKKEDVGWRVVKMLKNGARDLQRP